MLKVCHLRGNKDYWKTHDMLYCFLQHPFFPYYSNIVKLWDKLLNINYLTFRKQIRDIIINSIKEKNYFDLILKNNQSCKEFLNKKTNKNILFFQQDDDDIFLGIPNTDTIKNGINIFSYSFVDPIGGRRSQGYRCREFGLNKPTHTIQTNHSIIYNEKGDLNMSSLKLHEADHTFYNKLIKQYPYTVHTFPISIQIYHLHSISLWKNQYKKSFSGTNLEKENNFLYFVNNYVEEFYKILLKHPDIPLLKQMNMLYKKLI